MEPCQPLDRQSCRDLGHLPRRAVGTSKPSLGTYLGHLTLPPSPPYLQCHPQNPSHLSFCSSNSLQENPPASLHSSPYLQPCLLTCQRPCRSADWPKRGAADADADADRSGQHQQNPESMVVALGSGVRTTPPVNGDNPPSGTCGNFDIVLAHSLLVSLSHHSLLLSSLIHSFTSYLGAPNLTISPSYHLPHFEFP